MMYNMFVFSDLQWMCSASQKKQCPKEINYLFICEAEEYELYLRWLLSLLLSKV